MSRIISLSYYPQSHVRRAGAERGTLSPPWLLFLIFSLSKSPLGPTKPDRAAEAAGGGGEMGGKGWGGAGGSWLSSGSGQSCGGQMKCSRCNRWVPRLKFNCRIYKFGYKRPPCTWSLGLAGCNPPLRGLVLMKSRCYSITRSLKSALIPSLTPELWQHSGPRVGFSPAS